MWGDQACRRQIGTGIRPPGRRRRAAIENEHARAQWPVGGPQEIDQLTKELKHLTTPPTARKSPGPAADARLEALTRLSVSEQPH